MKVVSLQKNSIMRVTHKSKLFFGLVAASAALAFATPVFAIDAGAAEMLARQSGCLKCHSLDTKKKDGPPYREVAAKYKGKAGAEAKLYLHVTTGAKVKFPDGHEEDHEVIKTKNAPEIKNLVSWILSQ